ncbi:protein containing SET domain protein [Pyrenophora tritici-repentis]|nr:protein containing SET domain protein [Pyrenophora tritici-repentis]KAG9382792.1 protein containing SET domain protein [Pyrenophora tritici-repentis]PZD33833.1 JmjC multi-domain protein [Pyrenophora tritici-repentis]
MVSTIQEARDKLLLQDVNERGYFILEVQETWDASELTKLLHTAKAPGRDEIKGFKLARGTSDCLHAQVARNISLSLQDIKGFSEARASIQPKMEFEEWIAEPPECVQYLVCEPLANHAVNRLLDAGSQCNRRPEIPGVNRPYWYVSGGPNTPATLHIEDGNTGSANLLLAGAEKHWIIVPRSSADKLESCIREQYPASKLCSQFLRHHDVIVGPRWLEARGIHYEIVCQKPGDLLVTLPGRIYHEVRNTGRNFAMAINYEFPDAPDEPAGYVWCENGEGKCGQGVLTRASFMPTTSDRAFDTENETPEDEMPHLIKKRMHSGVESASKRLRTMAPLRRRRTTRPVQRILRLSRVPTPISTLAPVPNSLPHVILSAILSKASLWNCARLVAMWRLQSTRIELAPESEDKISRLAALDKRVCLAQSRNWLYTLMSRLAQFDMASALDSNRQGAIRLDGTVYDKVLKEQGLNDVTKKDRDKLKERVKKARKFFQICQEFDRGLLCLLPFMEISENQLSNMTTAEIEEFHVLAAEKKLDIAGRCKIGISIQDMFTRDVEFAFEKEDLTAFDRLSEREMVALLQPVAYPKVNSYTPDSAWPKPPSWPWEWPMDPTWAPLAACEICSLEGCICLSNLAQDRHRIVDYGPKGRGIQARGALSGGLAFSEGEYIQELVGEVKPLEWSDHRYRSVDFKRPDIGMTCRLYCEEESNWARLVNHACDPCAELTVKVTRGRARMMLRARRDIWDGTEITVDYGEAFSADEGCLCATCSKSAVLTKDKG